MCGVCVPSKSILSQIHVCNAFSSLLITHDTCTCTPLVGYTYTDRLLIHVTVHYDWYPLHPPTDATPRLTAAARAQVGYLPMSVTVVVVD